MVFYVADDYSSIGIERRKKGLKMNKEREKWIGCHGIGKIQQIGSSFNAAALSTECHGIRNGRKLVE